MLYFVDDATPPEGFDADEVVVRITSGKSTSFFYDPQERAYYMRQYNRDFVDANDDSRPVFTNIVILKTSVTPIRGDDSGRLDVVTVGRGEGYFISGGKYIEINWSRRSESDQFVYTRRNGAPIDFGVGKTFICITPTNLDATFE